AYVRRRLQEPGNLVHALVEEGKTVHIQVPARFGWAHERLICPVRQGHHQWGYLSLAREIGSAFDDVDKMLLEWTALQLAAHYLQQRVQFGTRRQIEAELVSQFLTPSLDLPHRTHKLHLLLEWSTRPLYVFLFRWDWKYRSLDQVTNARSQLVEAIDDAAAANDFPILCVHRFDELALLCPKDAIDVRREQTRTMGERLVTAIRNHFPDLSVYLGISGVCPSLTELSTAMEQAEQALRLARLLPETSGITAWDDIGLFGVILQSAQSDTLQRVALQLLHRLIVYDREKGSELLRTLALYLDHRSNVRDTARQLSVSVGAARYRLKRIRELLQVDVDDPRRQLDLQLALRVLRFSNTLDEHYRPRPVDR
ncbi:MAG: helix-turn-helix domain-containing protein, partial [Alicyclobacillus shizuokensis]|nr:helix-turn-helix domain-containing protein [Alicyclobacillus shizuokensis]